MLVADALQNPTGLRSNPKLSHDLPHRHHNPVPQPPFHLAVIPTAWGLCGAVWSVPSNDADPAFTFSE